MKKILAVCLILCVLLCGCASAGNRTDDTSSNLTDNTSSNASVPDYSDIDFDLTKLDEDAAYTLLYNILCDPDSYVGAMIKVSGWFISSQFGDTYYYMCGISNSSLESYQAIEFIPLDDLCYPDDFPENNQPITVTGQFATYYEDGSLYATLKYAKIEY